MELKYKIVILDEKNISRLFNLYGEIKDVDELSQIVNKHIAAAIDEIEEDCSRQRNEMAMAIINRKYPYRGESDFDGEC